LPLAEALTRAKEFGLDLIEVASTAHPPVAKIISYDKYRYQESKKLKKQRAKQKGPEFKQVRITVRSAKHDLKIRADKVNEFLSEGHVVEIQMPLRGREKGNRDWARGKMQEFLKMITPDHKVVMDIKYFGKGFNVQVTKK